MQLKLLIYAQNSIPIVYLKHISYLCRKQYAMILELKKVMKEKGIKQSELAERLGVTSQYISGVCTGRLSISFKRLNEIAEILGVEALSLLVPSDNSTFRCPHCGGLIRVNGEKDD